MVNSRKEGKEVVERLIAAFAHFPKELYCSFGDFCEQVTVQDIKLVSLQDLAVKPDKRERDGKDYTPSVGLIHCDECSLLFVLEDVGIVVTLEGLRLTVGAEYSVTFSTKPPIKKQKQS